METTDVMNGKYLNVYMRGSPSDVGRTEGLCGSLDGNMDNDITASVDDFNTFWRWAQPLCLPSLIRNNIIKKTFHYFRHEILNRLFKFWMNFYFFKNRTSLLI